MRHRGIKERPNPQLRCENAVCMSRVECTEGRPAGRALLPAPQPGPAGRERPRPRQAEKSPCPDGNGQDPSEMETGRKALILMKDETQLLNFKGYPMAFSRHSTKEPADRKSLSTSTNLM